MRGKHDDDLERESESLRCESVCVIRSIYKRGADENEWDQLICGAAREDEAYEDRESVYRAVIS